MIQGVNDYSASIEGYLAGGDPAGSAEMAVQIEAAKAACPSTKLVASGYSQGGQLVHNSIAMLPAATAEWISKVVIFGDPGMHVFLLPVCVERMELLLMKCVKIDDGKPIPNVATSKIDVYCSPQDNICVNGDLILPAHLLYAEDAGAAAAFVAA